jgi:hypothetical protein
MKNFRSLLLFISCVFILLGSNSCTKEESQEKEINKTPNLQATGSSANDILSNTNFDKMVIEIAHVSGFRPSQETISQFTDFLRQYTFKQDIEVQYLVLESSNEEDFTLEEIVDLENENRTAYNDGRTLAIYIYFADAPSEGDDMTEGLVTVGAVYRNTSMVIYEDTIIRLASQSSVISVTDIESATLNHEFGHLFGLVDLGTRMVNDHETQSENSDGELVGDNHCNVEGCLMRRELQLGRRTGKSNIADTSLKSACNLSGTTMMQLLQSKTGKSNTVDLGAECVLDLKGNGGR